MSSNKLLNNTNRTFRSLRGWFVFWCCLFIVVAICWLFTSCLHADALHLNKLFLKWHDHLKVFLHLTILTKQLFSQPVNNLYMHMLKFLPYYGVISIKLFQVKNTKHDAVCHFREFISFSEFTKLREKTC